jgi:regulator of protease activity HflC (stomatin/prohibitin superfamily)
MEAGTMMKEKVRGTIPGGLMLLFWLGALVGSIVLLVMAGKAGSHLPKPLPETAPYAIGGAVGVIASLIGLGGFFIVNPNEARVLQFLGRYIGTVKGAGLHWVPPFVTKRPISLRVRNFESEKLKVNDLDGNPIEIAAVIVWKVVDTAEALFQVENYEHYVRVQSEAAVRNLAARYPYDSHEDEKLSLRGATAQVVDHLRQEIHARLEAAGVEIVEARITHLAYSPEIAQAMLQRQQAGAIIAARTRIVDGAVGMVEMALERLAAKNVVQLDEEKKATMVSNLLVVLCGERATQPVINAGTIY